MESGTCYDIDTRSLFKIKWKYEPPSVYYESYWDFIFGNGFEIYMHGKSQVGFAKTELFIHSTQGSSPKLGGLATVVIELSLLHFSVAATGVRW